MALLSFGRKVEQNQHDRELSCNSNRASPSSSHPASQPASVHCQAELEIIPENSFRLLCGRNFELKINDIKKFVLLLQPTITYFSWSNAVCLKLVDLLDFRFYGSHLKKSDRKMNRK